MKTLKDFKPPFSVNDDLTQGYVAGAPTFWIVDANGEGVTACPPPLELAQDIVEALNARTRWDGIDAEKYMDLIRGRDMSDQDELDILHKLGGK
jgi:hypothetical protein